MRLDELEKNQPQFSVGDTVVIQDEMDAHNGEQGTVEKVFKENKFNRIMFGDAYIYHVNVNGKTFSYGADEIIKVA